MIRFGSAILSLSLTPGRKEESPPQSIPGSPRGVIDQLQTAACDELPEIGSWGLWHFAGPVRLDDIRPRCFHHEKVAAILKVHYWLTLILCLILTQPGQFSCISCESHTFSDDSHFSGCLSFILHILCILHIILYSSSSQYKIICINY